MAQDITADQIRRALELHVQVEHEAGSFLAVTRRANSRAEAVQTAFIRATEAWGLDVIDCHIATEADIAEAQGQVTDLDTDV